MYIYIHTYYNNKVLTKGINGFFIFFVKVVNVPQHLDGVKIYLTIVFLQVTWVDRNGPFN